MFRPAPLGADNPARLGTAPTAPLPAPPEPAAPPGQPKPRAGAGFPPPALLLRIASLRRCHSAPRASSRGAGAVSWAGGRGSRAIAPVVERKHTPTPFFFFLPPSLVAVQGFWKGSVQLRVAAGTPSWLTPCGPRGGEAKRSWKSRGPAPSSAADAAIQMILFLCSIAAVFVIWDNNCCPQRNTVRNACLYSSSCVKHYSLSPAIKISSTDRQR